ncbi:MAG: alanine racemase [Ruminococcaceae bacterium]|nr:alanine racemase [Oscillospiraceae bacterium]
MQERTWAEISLDNIEFNYHSIRKHLKEGVGFLGVVKANAYGHGAVMVAQRLEALGCERFAVATIDEAIELREGGITAPIIILGYTKPAFTMKLIENNITQSVGDLGVAREMSKIAAESGKTLRIHLKTDSGMGRLGMICHDEEDPTDSYLEIMAMPGFDVEGIFTHFAVSEVLGDEYTLTQFDDFMNLVDRLEKGSGKRFRIKHCANSGAMINYPEMQLDMVRPGLMLYGMYPGGETGGIELRPAMEVKSRIVSIKTMEAGYSISYGRTHTTSGQRRIAVIPMGYADGLHRALSNKLVVSVNGSIVSQVGNICMDMCMLDVTNANDPKVGDVVTIFGHDGDNILTVEDVAEKAGTISYEMCCALSPRIPRIYV